MQTPTFDAKAAERNARLMMLEGTLFWAGLSFLQGDTVITNFIHQTTGSVALAGLAATVKTLMALIGQFTIGLFIHRIRVQWRFMAVLGFISRPLILLMSPMMMLGLPGPAAALGFFILYGGFFFIDGLIGLFWAEICTRTLPLARRGEVVVMQQTFAGVLGLGSGWVLRLVLGSALSFENQYVIIFGISGLIMLLNCVVLSRIRDVEHDSAPDRPPINPVKYIARILPILRENKPLRITLISRALYLMTLISAPINLMFGRFAGLSEAQLATLVFMPVFGQIIAGILWSQVCRRLSYPVMMLMAEALGILCALANIACYFIARAGLPVMVPLSVAMVLVAINMPAYTGFYQHMITLIEPERRADAIVLSALVMAPLSLGTYLAGAIVEHVGYLPVYLLMMLCGTVGLVLVRRHMAVTAK
jgi:hypothetical protein